MAEWQEVQLGDLVCFEYGVALRAESRTGRGFPVYGSNGVVGRHDTAFVPGPGIIVGRKGSVGALQWSRGDFWPIDTTYWVRPTVGLDLRWMRETLGMLSLETLDSSTGVPGMNRADAYELRVPVPPLEEQRRIAEVLDTIDETIQATDRVVTKHEEVRAGLAAVLLSDVSGLDSPPPQRGSATCRVVALGEIVQILDSRRVPVREEDRPIGSVPYYGANGQQGWIDRALFNEPLILLAEDGGHFEEFADRPIAYRIEGPSWVNNHAHVLRAARGVDQSYLFWSLRNRDIRRWVAGGTRSKLTQSEMERIRLLIPPYEEQRRIAAILDAVDEVIQSNEDQLDKLERLRSGLAADLLSGRVRTVAA